MRICVKKLINRVSRRRRIILSSFLCQTNDGLTLPRITRLREFVWIGPEAGDDSIDDPDGRCCHLASDRGSRREIRRREIIARLDSSGGDRPGSFVRCQMPLAIRLAAGVALLGQKCKEVRCGRVDRRSARTIRANGRLYPSGGLGAARIGRRPESPLLFPPRRTIAPANSRLAEPMRRDDSPRLLLFSAIAVCFSLH